MLKTEVEIINWLNQYNIENYYINDDLTVDVFETVDISNQKLKEIPIQFNVVIGNFFIYRNHNQITTLKHSPKLVGEYYSCNDNNLISLKGCPKIINGSFTCANNKLTSLKYSPKNVKLNYECYNNYLT